MIIRWPLNVVALTLVGAFAACGGRTLEVDSESSGYDGGLLFDPAPPDPGDPHTPGTGSRRPGVGGGSSDPPVFGGSPGVPPSGVGNRPIGPRPGPPVPPNFGGRPSTPPRPGTGGGPAFPPNACAPDFCPAMAVPGGLSLSGCCVARQCGVDTSTLGPLLNIEGGCHLSEPSTPPDPSCPSTPTPVGITLAGCCTSSGYCGTDMGPLGLGCIGPESGPVVWCESVPRPASPRPPIPVPPPTTSPPVPRPPPFPTVQPPGPIPPPPFPFPTVVPLPPPPPPPAPPTSNEPCCESSTLPGCRSGSIMRCVCDRDPYCCANQWDAQCASEVTSFGCGGCGVDPIDQCIQHASTECDACTCEACFAEASDCFADAGCPLILQCANQTGCSGVDCYRPNTCQVVIDAVGGPFGTSVSLAIPVFECVTGTGCPCGFANP